MTNDQKAYLRRLAKNRRDLTPEDMADLVGCTVATARKYVRVFAPPIPDLAELAAAPPRQPWTPPTLKRLEAGSEERPAKRISFGLALS